MRANQKRVAQSLAGAPRTDTRDVKRGLAVVPFRHSKLTEVLMDYFVGDGKAVSTIPLSLSLSLSLSLVPHFCLSSMIQATIDTSMPTGNDR